MPILSPPYPRSSTILLKCPLAKAFPRRLWAGLLLLALLGPLPGTTWTGSPGSPGSPRSPNEAGLLGRWISDGICATVHMILSDFVDVVDNHYTSLKMINHCQSYMNLLIYEGCIIV